MTGKQILSQSGYWQVNKAVAWFFQDVSTALLMSHLVDQETYHEASGTLSKHEGEYWFYSTADDIQNATCLSYKQQKARIAKIEETGCLVTNKFGLPAKIYYKFDHKELTDFVTKCYAEKKEHDVARRENKSLQKVKTVTDKREEQYLTKGKDNNKNRVIRIEEKEERGAREFSLPVNSSPVQTKPVAAAVSLEDKYPDPADKAEAIYQRCIDTLKANTMLFPVVIKQANINITKEQFAGELRKWVEYYIHDSKFFKDAHKRINYGRGSFKSWLSSDKTRDQYAKLNAATVSKVLKGKSPFEQLRELRAKQTA